jgi:hypothetical protein
MVAVPTRVKARYRDRMSCSLSLENLAPSLASGTLQPLASSGSRAVAGRWRVGTGRRPLCAECSAGYSRISAAAGRVDNDAQAGSVGRYES